ncbi:MAG: Response regulator receiver protein [uncultured bacterium]|nr:MAG: Response regulator receiver protein [uncultured bacterium]HBY73674.1 response regulator [Candidatus Kerfeldbacteria bacterium]
MAIDLAAKSILVVEDESFLSKVLAERLEDEGFGRIDVAGNGEEAITKVKQHRPDIILLDMILPKMNGFEVLETLQADTKLATIPVLVLSNLGQDQDIEQAKKLGARDYIVKSNFSLQKVVEKIMSIIG